MSEISNAVRTLTTALRNDSGFYQSYQANIAMAMYDEWEAFMINRGSSIADDVRPMCINLCNVGAKRFLDMWINSKDKEVPDWFKEAF